MSIHDIDLDTPLGLLAILRPASVRVLMALGVDLALEHDRSFEEACAMRDLRAHQVMARIARAERVDDGEGEAAWETLRAARPTWPPLPAAVSAR